MTLAKLAGSTVTAAATTGAWEAARHKFAQLLGHGDPAKTKLLEQRLTETHEQLIGAAGASRESARATLAAEWGTLLTDLLEEDPAIEADLRALVEEMDVAPPTGAESSAGRAVAARRDLNTSADHGGSVPEGAGKDVMPLGPTGPGLANSRPGPGSMRIRFRMRSLPAASSPPARQCKGVRPYRAS